MSDFALNYVLCEFCGTLLPDQIIGQSPFPIMFQEFNYMVESAVYILDKSTHICITDIHHAPSPEELLVYGSETSGVAPCIDLLSESSGVESPEEVIVYGPNDTETSEGDLCIDLLSDSSGFDSPTEVQVYGVEAPVQTQQIYAQRDIPEPTFSPPIDNTDDLLLLFNDPQYQEILNDLRDSFE